jgi:predicted ATPase/DNA-binding SARP family transcriptional activator
VHYRVLGPLAPTSASAQQRLLLSYLLVHANRFVTADRLVEELWGSALPADAAAALRTQVARVRRRLPAGALITEPGGYRLVVAGDDLDSAVFERLVEQGQVESALSLWRGGAYEEFAERSFAQVEAARLEQLRLHAEEARARRLMALGDASAAASAADALVAAHPERESARAVLMEALYRDGRQGAALATYQSWRKELVDEYGLEPTPELSQLQQHILRHHLPLPALPRPVDSFLGRDADVAQVRTLLHAARLLTLTGPGGVGKTRLAVEVAHAVADEYPDGATMCDLAAVSDAGAVARAVGWTLGLTEVSGNRIEDQLVGHLRGRRMLIVLDGCEHLLDAAADLAAELVSRTDEVTVLATSRERLAVPGEHLQAVAPLAAEASLRLFRDRARAVNTGLAATDEQVASVCSRLDGLPLAVELAAARVGSLRVDQMVSALDDRFAVLADRRRSLAATLQWSYDLLTDAERDALCRLSAFFGTFDREAAAAFGVDTGVLLRLADRSLVDGANPYRLLDSVRDYARDRLRDQQRLDQVTEQHVEWVLQLATAAAAGLSTADEQRWAQRLDLHFAELRAAHHWLVVHQPHRAVELIAALRTWSMWRARAEVFHWADAVADATGDPTALAAAATGAWQRGDLPRAVDLARRALPHRWAVETLAEVAFLNGDLNEAQRHYRQAADLAHAAGDGLQETWCVGSVILAAVYAGGDPGDQPEDLLSRAAALGGPSARAMAFFVVGESRRTDAPLLEAISLAEAVGSRFITGLARAALASLQAAGDPLAALDGYAEAIEQWHDSGAWPAYWVTLRTLIVLLTQLGLFQEAAVLFGANQAAAHAAPAYGGDAAALQTSAVEMQVALGTETLTRCHEQGASLSEDESAAYALAAIHTARKRLATAASR